MLKKSGIAYDPQVCAGVGFSDVPTGLGFITRLTQRLKGWAKLFVPLRGTGASRLPP